MEEQKKSLLPAIIALILSGVYLLNLTAGFVEIPDNLPIIGNLDELIVANVFIGALARLGIDLRPFVLRKATKDQDGKGNER